MPIMRALPANDAEPQPRYATSNSRTVNFVKNKQLVVDEHNLGELLRILNEDLARGGLTRDRFRIESKEPM